MTHHSQVYNPVEYTHGLKVRYRSLSRLVFSSNYIRAKTMSIKSKSQFLRAASVILCQLVFGLVIETPGYSGTFSNICCLFQLARHQALLHTVSTAVIISTYI